MNENGKLILINEDTAYPFHDYFDSIIENIDLHHWEDKMPSPSNTSDKINDIKNYEKHSSICNKKKVLVILIFASLCWRNQKDQLRS